MIGLEDVEGKKYLEGASEWTSDVLSDSQQEYLQELFVPEEEWNSMSESDKETILTSIKDRTEELSEANGTDVISVRTYVPEYLLDAESIPEVRIRNIGELCEDAEKITFSDVRETNPDVADYIDRISERLANNYPDGIMNTLEYYRLDDGTLVVKSSEEQYKNSHILVKGNYAYCEAGARYTDSHMNEFINGTRMMPNMTYNVDGCLTYITDAVGRTSRIEEHYENGVLMHRSDERGELKSVSNSKDGLPDDVGGHLIANNVGGPTEAINIVPMNKDFNNGGQWKKMENEILDAVKGNHDVKVTRDIKYEGDSCRPTGIDVKVVIDGEDYKTYNYDKI